MGPSPEHREADFDWDRAKEVHLELSPEAARFLDFVAREPRARNAESFQLLESENPSRKYAPQPWPTLVSKELAARLAYVNRAIAALIRSVPSRLLDNDPRRLADYYGLDLQRAHLLAGVLSDTEYVDSLIGRGDFVLGPSGFHCVEYNMSGNIGGFEIAPWEELYLRVPVLRQFFDEEGVRFRVPRSIASLWTHLVRQARRKDRLHDSSFNVVIGAPPGSDVSAAIQRFASEELQSVLAEQEPGMRGGVSICDYEDLERRGSRLYLGERRIHAIVGHGSTLTRDLFFAWMDGQVDLYNGALDRFVLPDKRNLALLSESAASGAFDEEEQRIIEDHIPWTRRLESVETSYRGETASLPEIVRTARRDLVLKPALGWSGRGVNLGAFTPPEEWERLVAEGLRSGDWIVQERVPSFHFWYHTGAEGCAWHDVVWGLFDWSGSGFHGGYVRMLASDAGGVVNVGRGATTGLIFEVDRDGRHP